MTVEPHSSLLKYVPEKGLVLDAGCGFFTYTKFLKKYAKGIEIVCVDIANLDVKESRKNNFVLSSVQNLPFDDSSFDFILCLSLVQLISNDRKAIEEFYRVLKKPGKLLLTVPTKLSVFRLLRELEIICQVYKYPEFNVKHYHYYNKSDIRSLVEEKFEIIDLYGYGYNCVPRLITFLASFFKLGAKPHRKREIDANLSKINIHYMRFSKLLEGLLRKFSDFSYHYIVVLGK